MVKTPFIVAGAAIVVVLVAALAFVLLHPTATPVAVAPVPATPPVAAVPPPQPAAPAAASVPPADCLLPGPPPVAPDGGKATAADMQLGHEVFQNFVLHLEAYQACRESEINKADASINDQQKQTWRDEGNAAVDEAQALAAAFSAQLKIYHKKHPEPLAPAPAQ